MTLRHQASMHNTRTLKLTQRVHTSKTSIVETIILTWSGRLRGWRAGWELQWAERWSREKCEWASLQTKEMSASCRRCWRVVESRALLRPVSPSSVGGWERPQLSASNSVVQMISLFLLLSPPFIFSLSISVGHWCSFFALHITTSSPTLSLLVHKPFNNHFSSQSSGVLTFCQSSVTPRFQTSRSRPSWTHATAWPGADIITFILRQLGGRSLIQLVPSLPNP